MGGLIRDPLLLNRFPGIRERVAAMAEFIAWRDALPVVAVDAESFYLVGGYQLDQLSDQSRRHDGSAGTDAAQGTYQERAIEAAVDWGSLRTDTELRRT